MKKKKQEKTLINISKKTFFQVCGLLAALLIVAIILTYVIPAGSFGTLPAKTPDGEPETDYSVYIPSEESGGIPIWKGLLAPVLVFASGDGLALIMLCLFLLVISAAFQVMSDAGGISALVGAIADRFKSRRRLLAAAISLLFMCFGAFLGLFEEMLTMLPIVTALCITIGYDSFTGFLICIVACGFGFASAVTNPFTVLLASEIIGTNPMENIWFRIVIFLVMYLLLQGFLFLYLRRIDKNKKNSYTYAHDKRLRFSGTLRETEAQPAEQTRKVRLVYSVFLLLSLALIVVCSFLEALRGYTVPILIAYFLLFGLAAGMLSTGKPKQVLRSFGRGLLGALPTIAFIGLSASVKYVLEEGSILPTIANSINLLTVGNSPFVITLIIFAVVLVLEFFISSSTAKAFLVMGLLSVVNIGLSKQMSVLIYTFGDGYTNVLFPTSPVLLISLSMIELDYMKWVKKSAPLFACTLALVLLFLGLGLVIGY